MARDAIQKVLHLGVEPGLPAPEVRTTTFTNAVLLIVIGFIFPNMALGMITGTWWPVPVLFVHGLFIGGCLLLNARGQRYLASVSFGLVATAFVTFYAVAYGPTASNRLFLPMILFLQFFMFPATRRRTMIAMIILVTVAYGVTNLVGDRLTIDATQAFVDAQEGLARAGLLGLSVLFGFYAWVTIRDAEDGLEQERARSDVLLLNVLPASVAARLKEGEEPIADQFAQVSVLFADLVGFTPLSETMRPEDTVRLLNELFSAFDDICERHGVEKIRTIGDGYMAAAGAPLPREDHAAAVGRVALEMAALVRRVHPELEVRIGVNTGEAVGGIVGTSKFHYDLWGDAVNVAARLESHGQAGRIQIGEATQLALAATFDCEARGTIEIKGKGQMPTWWLLAESVAADPVPS